MVENTHSQSLVENNSMKLNQDKCHLLFLESMYENIWAKIHLKKKLGKKQKLLDVENGRTLCFDEYIASLCKNAGNK